MLCVGLTGNIASGKSTVASAWRELGAEIIDADVLAREAIAPGTRGHSAVLDAFGTVDRRRLRELVFDDAAKRLELESIIHPEVARLRAELEARLEQQGARIVVNDIPLLFEAGLQDQFEVIVLVDAAVKTRIERIVETRGLTREVAAQMVAAQMPAELKRARATFLIENDGSKEALAERAAAVWREIESRAA